MILKKTLITLMSMVILTGCAHVISKETLKETDENVTFKELRKDPSVYRGRLILLGGVVVRAINEKNGTLLEVYQTKLESGGKPIDLDRSEGRFMALYKGFLDGEIYRKGREVTIAGTVEGEKTMRLGEIHYKYPYLTVKEIHLWKKEPQINDLDPWGPWGPYWYDPHWRWRDPYWHNSPYR